MSAPLSSNDFIHTSVLLAPSVDAMLLGADVRAPKNGVYVDATFGRGGHSRYLLQQLDDDAILVVFDKDPEAILCAKNLAKLDDRVRVVHDSFANLNQNLQNLGIKKVHGIIADLGVSSPQLDDGARGFSFMNDGAVDMRMDTTRGMSAAKWLKQVDETTLANVLYEYGQERHSRRIARAIKAMDDYTSTIQLAQVIKDAHPAWQKGKHPATKSFQAIRIFINNELADIHAFLNDCISLLHSGAALSVISFHSLEDKIVKQFFKNHSAGKYVGDDALLMPPVRPKYFYKPVRIAPDKNEILQNTRARSAYLRYAIRTDVPFIDGA